MELFVQGFQREQIAARLNCGGTNVSQMLKRASDRLGAKSNVQAAIKYVLKRQETY